MSAQLTASKKGVLSTARNNSSVVAGAKGLLKEEVSFPSNKQLDSFSLDEDFDMDACYNSDDMSVKDSVLGSKTADWSVGDKEIDSFIKGDKEISNINHDYIVSPAFDQLPHFTTAEPAVVLPSFSKVFPVTEVITKCSLNNHKIASLSVDRGMNRHKVITSMFTVTKSHTLMHFSCLPPFRSAQCVVFESSQEGRVKCCSRYEWSIWDSFYSQCHDLTHCCTLMSAFFHSDHFYLS